MGQAVKKEFEYSKKGSVRRNEGASRCTKEKHLTKLGKGKASG